MKQTEELMTLIDRYAFFVPGSESSDLAREDVKRAIDLALQNTRDEALEDAATVCDRQHDRARTSTGATRANACANSIRAMKGK